MEWFKGKVNDKTPYRGWLIGSFIGVDSGPAHTDAVEVKYGVHKAGEKRIRWTDSETRTTLLIIVSGKFKLNLTVGTDILEAGEYVVWGPGIEHTWEVIEDTIAITVRWPSKAE